MPPVFDLEHYITLKPAPGTGPGRFLALHFLMSIRDQATRWELGSSGRGVDAENCYYIAGVKYVLVPPPISAVLILSRFLKQLAGEDGVLTLHLGDRQLAVHVRIKPGDVTDQIAVELPISSASQAPAARLLDGCTTNSDSLIEFEDTEFEDEVKERGPRMRFQLRTKPKRRDWDCPPFLGRRRMPFHPDMHAPTKFLMMVLIMCYRDGAMELRFSPAAEDLWTRYSVEGKWYDLVPPPAFVWPQLVRVIERHTILIRPESDRLDTPAVGWLELRWGQDYAPDNLAVFLDTREASAMLQIKFLQMLPKSPETTKPTETPTDDADADDRDTYIVEFSPDDQ